MIYSYRVPSPININFAWIKHYSLRKHISEIHPDPCPYTRVITILNFQKWNENVIFASRISLVHHHWLTPFPFNLFSEGIMFKHWQIGWNPSRYTVAIYHFSKDRFTILRYENISCTLSSINAIFTNLFSEGINNWSKLKSIQSTLIHNQNQSLKNYMYRKIIFSI